MTDYDLTIRFRTNDAEPRKEMTAEQIAKTIVPFVFPHKGTVLVMGSTMLRVDERKK
jgi:hypothetical protein